jgi:hypothetical protein
MPGPPGADARSTATGAAADPTLTIFAPAIRQAERMTTETKAGAL